MDAGKETVESEPPSASISASPPEPLLKPSLTSSAGKDSNLPLNDVEINGVWRSKRLSSGVFSLAHRTTFPAIFRSSDWPDFIELLEVQVRSDQLAQIRLLE